MTYGDRARHFCLTSGTSQRGAGDELLEVMLHRMTIEDLRRLQGALHETLRTDQPSNVIAGDGNRDDGSTSVMPLLGAVAVAIAWWTHRAKPAPQRSIQQGIDVVYGGHPYLLPIPRHDPCFCGSQTPFRTCHGQPPNAVPSMGSNHLATNGTGAIG